MPATQEQVLLLGGGVDKQELTEHDKFLLGYAAHELPGDNLCI